MAVVDSAITGDWTGIETSVNAISGALSNAVLLWSQASTWATLGEPVPTIGADVMIPAGYTVVLDTDTVALSCLDIAGTLVASQSHDVSITSGCIEVMETGELRIGTEAAPYTRNAVITLTGARPTFTDRFVPDVTKTTGPGNGKLSRLVQGAGAAAEIYTVIFTSASAFGVWLTTVASDDVPTYVSLIGTGTVNVLFNNKIRFIAVPGGTVWDATSTIRVTQVKLGFSAGGSKSRSIEVMDGGKLTLIGNPPAVQRTKLNAHATASATSFTLADSVTWAANDLIVIGPTDFYGTASGATDRLTLASASGTSITTTTGIPASRWGLMQYATDAGMSLTPGTLTNSEGSSAEAWDAIPKTLDERAPVINLTRNIKVVGADDSDWTTHKFGATAMFMGLTSQIKIDGVEWRRVGRAGAIGGYPIHWHMASYNMPDGTALPSDGTFLGAKTGDFVKRCSVHESGQRAIVIHGTHGVTVDANVCHDITGHAIFLEDGSEKANTITNNVVMKVRSPTAANTLVIHDINPSELGGSTGFWYTNPANTFSGNWAADCQGTGIWNAFAAKCFGLSMEVAEVPRTAAILVHDNNTIHGNATTGMVTEFPQVNNSGDTAPSAYAPIGEFAITNQKVWKNTSGGYRNRINQGLYRGWTTADNEGVDYFGAAQSQYPDLSRADRAFGIGESLNNATSRLSKSRSCFASYHESLNFQDSVFVNFPYVAPVYGTSLGRGSGVIDLSDLYTQGLYEFSFNVRLKKVNSHMGAKILPPHLDGQPYTGDLTPPYTNRHWTLAGAIRDTVGHWVTAGDSFIYDHPFLTHNASGLYNATPTGSGKGTPDRFYGIENAASNFASVPFEFKAPVSAYRLDGSNAEVSGGSWVVPDGNTSQFVTQRNLSFAKNGRYKVLYPGSTVNGYVGLIVTFADLSTDTFLVAIQWAGGTPVTKAFTTTKNNLGGATAAPSAGDLSANQARNMTSAANLAAVEAGSGDKFWQDTANDLCWVKYVGGLAGPYEYPLFKPHSIFLKA